MSTVPAVSIVLPTYNESESLPVIVPRIVETLRAGGIDGEVIVVDDDSPDHTAEVARRLGETWPVRVIKRVEERGLATAVLAGFAASEAPVVIVMDADGSHPTSALPGMVKLIAEDKADIVVGSRHVPGGGSVNWPLFSQLKSKLAASLTFGLTSMTDPTTGFMAIRRELLHGLELDPVGWKIVLEIVVKAMPARVAEVPIVFEDRELGESKQSVRVFAQYAEHVAKLYAHRYPGLAELLRFCIVGFIGMVVDLSTVIACKELLALDTRLCAVAGFSVAVTTNFVLNRRYTFARARELPLAFSYLTYVGANLVGLSVRMLAVHLLIVLASLDRGHGYVLSNFIGIVLATLVNFVGAKYFAFDPNRFASVPPPDAPPSEPALPGRAKLAAGALALAVAVATLVQSTAGRELREPDEAVNLVMAQNVASDARLLVRPSVVPGGRRDWVAEDLPALGNTPFFATLLAPLARHGLSTAGLLPWLSLWLAIAMTALLPVPRLARAGVYTGLLLLGSPAFVTAALSLELEPTLVAFCAAGLLAFVRGASSRRLGLCALGGLLGGLGFLTKMWLVLPYALAACAFVLVQTTLGRARSELPIALRRSVLAAAAGFAAAGSAHLVLVALLAPQDLGRWVSWVYLGIFSGHGITGGKLSALGTWSDAVRPFWYYPALLVREHFHVLPLALLGLPALTRRARTTPVATLAMAFGASLAVVVLSVPAVKEPLYVLAVLPLVYALAGTCLAEVETDDTKHGPANRALAEVSAGLGIAGAVVLGALASWGAPRSWIAALGPAVLTAAAGWVALGIARRKALTARVLTLAALGALVQIASAATLVPPPERALAAALAPHLRVAEPAYPSFEAPRSRVLMGYLGRAGSDLRPHAPGGEPARAVVLGPEQLVDPRYAERLQALERTHDELRSAELPAGYRVFMRR